MSEKFSVGTKKTKQIKHPSLKGIQVYLNKRFRSFPMGDNNEIAKVH